MESEVNLALKWERSHVALKRDQLLSKLYFSHQLVLYSSKSESL